MHVAHKAIILIATLAIGAGRAEAQDPWDPQASQGTHIQVPQFDSIYVPSVPGRKITAPNGELSDSSTKPLSATARFKTSAGSWTTKTVNLIVKGKYTHQNPYGLQSPAAHEYEVLYDGDKPLCPNNNRALAIPGQYVPVYPSNPTVDYWPVDGVSFACTGYETGETWPSGRKRLAGAGAAAKCVDWGYPPWKYTNTPPLPWVGTTAAGNLNNPTDNGKILDMHRTCLFVAVADYCGDGIRHTVDGTFIYKYNDVSVSGAHLVVNTGPNAGNMQPDFYSVTDSLHYFLEAAWRPVLPDVRNGGALCLSKLRWSTMAPALSAACPTIAPPFRQTFCEDIQESQLEAQGALLFTYSLFIDQGLYKCQVQPNVWKTFASDAPPTTNPGCSASIFEGVMLRNNAAITPLPDGFPVAFNGPPKPVPLYLHTISSSQFITNTKQHEPGEVSGSPGQPIGYVLPTPVCPGGNGNFCGDALKLYKYKSGGLDQYLTTTKTPPPIPGIVAQAVLGYMLKFAP
jgi:hypothetical protein